MTQNTKYTGSVYHYEVLISNRVPNTAQDKEATENTDKKIRSLTKNLFGMRYDIDHGIVSVTIGRVHHWYDDIYPISSSLRLKHWDQDVTSIQGIFDKDINHNLTKRINDTLKKKDEGLVATYGLIYGAALLVGGVYFREPLARFGKSVMNLRRRVDLAQEETEMMEAVNLRRGGNLRRRAPKAADLTPKAADLGRASSPKYTLIPETAEGGASMASSASGWQPPSTSKAYQKRMNRTAAIDPTATVTQEGGAAYVGPGYEAAQPPVIGTRDEWLGDKLSRPLKKGELVERLKELGWQPSRTRAHPHFKYTRAPGDEGYREELMGRTLTIPNGKHGDIVHDGELDGIMRQCGYDN